MLKSTKKFLKLFNNNYQNLITKTRYGVQDFTHIYDGILDFQDKGLGDDLLQIKNQALDFAKKKLAPYSQQWQKSHHFPVDTIREAAQMGYSAIYIKEGTGLGRLQASLIFEALSTGCVPTTAYLSIHNMCLWILSQFGNQQQKAQYMEKLINMEYFSSYCLTQPDSGSDAKAMKSFAKKEGNQYILNGSKVFISGGSVSDIYFVMAKTSPTEVSTFIVQKKMKGVGFGKLEQKMGWKISPTTMVTFQDVRIPEKNRIGSQGIGFKIAMKALDGGRVNIASCSLGGAAFCLETAKKYLLSRKQFGKKLSEHQYLQFKYADMATDLVSSRLLVRRAAQMIQNDDPNKTLYASMAKRLATDKCSQLVDYALQMHGGYGYLCQYGVQKYLRDLRVHQILQGTNQIMRLIIARKLITQ